jgi:hypothetical protein
LEARLERLEALLAERGEQLAQRDARIAELEMLLAESRRSGEAASGAVQQGRPEAGPGPAGPPER